MKKLLLLLLFPSLAFAQEDARDNFTDTFRGRETVFTYSNEAGECVTEDYVTQFGIYDRRLDSIPLFESALGNPATFLTGRGAPLAAEHHWASFELLMKCQREYWAEVAKINIYHRILGAPPIDAPGQPFEPMIINISQYWVPFNILDNFDEYPPGELTYIIHFIAGLDGLNQCITHRDNARAYTAHLRSISMGRPVN